MPRTRVLIRFNYLLASILISFILLLPVYLYYGNTRGVLIEREGNHAKNLAIAVEGMIQEDIKAYRALVQVPKFEQGVYDEAYYARMLRRFNRIKNTTDISFLFTMRLYGEKSQYILDGEDPGSDDFSPIGEEDRISETAEKVLQTGLPQANGLVRDPKWGDYITGYAPIIDASDNTQLGLVGVDYSSEHVLRLLRNLRVLIILSQLLIFGLVLLLLNTAVHRKLQTFRMDPLTGLMNKTHFNQELHDAILRAKTAAKPACLAMIDIDDFKNINDTCGHIIGDRVLTRAGGIIGSMLRKTDIAARYGGDEFLIFFWDTHPTQALALCEGIIERVQADVIALEQDQLKYTVSIGIASWSKWMEEKELLCRADKAMYISKSQGKNRVFLA